MKDGELYKIELEAIAKTRLHMRPCEYIASEARSLEGDMGVNHHEYSVTFEIYKGKFGGDEIIDRRNAKSIYLLILSTIRKGESVKIIVEGKQKYQKELEELSKELKRLVEKDWEPSKL